MQETISFLSFIGLIIFVLISIIGFIQFVVVHSKNNKEMKRTGIFMMTIGILMMMTCFATCVATIRIITH